MEDLINSDIRQRKNLNKRTICANIAKLRGIFLDHNISHAQIKNIRSAGYMLF